MGKTEFVVRLLLGGVCTFAILELLAVFLGKPFDVPSLLLSIGVLFAIEVIAMVISSFFRNARYTETITGSFAGIIAAAVLFLASDWGRLFTLPFVTYDRVIWAVIKLTAVATMGSFYYFFTNYISKKSKLTPLTDD